MRPPGSGGFHALTPRPRVLHSAIMRPITLLSLLLLAVPAHAGAAPSAPATDPAVTEIRLGTPHAPPPAVDPARVRAVERFLAARQDGSVARSRGRKPGLGLPAPKGASSEDLYGPERTRLVAFDFANASIEGTQPGRFAVDVYLLFADDAGQVVESRNERLTFAGAHGSWACVARVSSATIAWESGAVRDAAATLGVSEELSTAVAHLKEWTLGRKAESAYSVADVAKDSDGRVVVQCLRFRAASGRRGFEVNDDPVVLTHDRGGVRVESN
jgi:hypothetical protein